MTSADLEAARRKLRLTWSELARALDVNPATVRRWKSSGEIPRTVELALRYLLIR